MVVMESKKYKISIITVCKNEDKTISRTIESVIKQTYNNIEFIVVDGNSTDLTLQILDEYKSKYNFKVIYNQCGGIYKAMNAGLCECSGDVVYFLNANDFLFDEFVIDDVMKYFNKYSNLEILCGNVQVIDEIGNYVSELNHSKFLSIRPYSYTNSCHQSMFYKKELFEKYGLYDTNFVICADYDKNIEFLVKNRVKYFYLDRLIACFQNNGLSNSKDSDNIKLFRDERNFLVKEKYKECFDKSSFKIALNMLKFLKNISEKPYKKIKKVDLKLSDFEPFFNKIFIMDRLNFIKEEE